MVGIAGDRIVNLLLHICPEQGKEYNFNIELPYADYAEVRVERKLYTADDFEMDEELDAFEGIHLFVLWKMKARQNRWWFEDFTFGRNPDGHGVGDWPDCSTGVIYPGDGGLMFGHWQSAVGDTMPGRVKADRPLMLNGQEVLLALDEREVSVMTWSGAWDKASDMILTIEHALGIDWKPSPDLEHEGPDLHDGP